MTLNIVINGEMQQLAKAENLAQALDELDNLPDNFAIAVNENFVPRSAYGQTPLKDGDQVELLVPMQGG